MSMEFIVAITVALLSFCGIAFGAFFSYLAAKHSRQANDAVNHTGDEGHRIYDLARTNSRMIEVTQQQLMNWILHQRQAMAEQTESLDALKSELKKHDEWERATKYVGEMKPDGDVQ